MPYQIRVTRGIRGKCIRYATFSSKSAAEKKVASIKKKDYWSAIWIASPSSPCVAPKRARKG